MTEDVYLMTLKRHFPFSSFLMFLYVQRLTSLVFLPTGKSSGGTIASSLNGFPHSSGHDAPFPSDLA